jgi:hypothetical protein
MQPRLGWKGWLVHQKPPKIVSSESGSEPVNPDDTSRRADAPSARPSKKNEGLTFALDEIF